MKTKCTPLTPQERAFAEANHSIVEKYLASNKLNPGEWYDVVIFRYLLSVKKWFHEPELHYYKFNTIAWWGMRSAVGNERRKQERRIQTVSLDAEIPGGDGLTLMDTITTEHLEYLYTGGDKMKISYNVKNIPQKPQRSFGKRSDETVAILSFIGTGMQNICFEYDSGEEAKKKGRSVNAFLRRNQLLEILDAYRIETKVYIVRKGEK